METYRLSGAILAGGENRRMNGQVKALLPFGGELLIQRQIREMKSICQEILIVTNEPHLYTELLDPSIVRTISDEIPRRGPLSGIHAALSASKQEDVWIVACDMPYISAEAGGWMMNLKHMHKVKAVIPTEKARIHPLHGIYDSSCITSILHLLQAGDYRVMQLLRNINWLEASQESLMNKGIDFRFTANLNTPEDYIHALQQGGDDGQ